MALLKSKIKCATLVEVLVAVTIIAISFFVGFSIYLNVVKSSFSENKLRASILAEEVMVNTIDKKIFSNESLIVDNFRIEKETTAYPSHEGLYVLQVNVFLPNNKLIYSKRQLIMDDEEI